MKLIFIGTGSAFTVGSGNYHSNMLLIAPSGDKLLIDVGTDARLSLCELGYTYRDIEHVYVSHLHFDHAGGLEWLGLTRKFDPLTDRPHLYIHEKFSKRVWDRLLSGSMRTIEGEIAQMETFFEVHPASTEKGFQWSGVQFDMVETDHIVDGAEKIPSYGLMFHVGGKTILITTDTQYSPKKLQPFYEKADIIFHDCETTETHSGVHAHYIDLCKLPDEIKQKTWLYHYSPGALPDSTKDGFHGFVQKGQSFEF